MADEVPKLLVKYLRCGPDGKKASYDKGAVAYVDQEWASSTLKNQDKTNPLLAVATEAELKAYEAEKKAAAEAEKKAAK